MSKTFILDQAPRGTAPYAITHKYKLHYVKALLSLRCFMQGWHA
jgi:hypothetical protein